MVERERMVETLSGIVVPVSKTLGNPGKADACCLIGAGASLLLIPLELGVWILTWCALFL